MAVFVFDFSSFMPLSPRRPSIHLLTGLIVTLCCWGETIDNAHYHSKKHIPFPYINLSHQKTYPVSFRQIVTAGNIPCFLLPNCHSRKPIPFPSMKLSQQKTYPVSFYRIVRLRQLKLDVEALRLHLFVDGGHTLSKVKSRPARLTFRDCDWPVCVRFGILRFSVLVR